MKKHILRFFFLFCFSLLILFFSSPIQAEDLNSLDFSSFYNPVEIPSVSPNIPSYDLPLDQSIPINVDDVFNALRYPVYEYNIRKNSVVVSNPGDAKKVLLNQGFVAAHIDEYYFYNPCMVEFYKCLRDKDIPLLITADSLLHLYHIQFDETLLEIETREFYPDLLLFTQAMLSESKAQYERYAGDLKQAARRNEAFFTVAWHLLDPASAPSPSSLVDQEVNNVLSLISSHAVFDPTVLDPIFHYAEDYSQYVPRGHYTRSETLKKYFKAMMWYGRMVFLLKGSNNFGYLSTNEAFISVENARIQTLQAALIASTMPKVMVSERTLFEIWQRIYTVTSFYVGVSDDLTPAEYLGALKNVFNWGPLDMETLAADENKFFDFKAELALIPSPQIYGGTGCAYVSETEPVLTLEILDDFLDKTKGMRFLGQRYVPDAYIMGQLVYPSVNYLKGEVSLNANIPFTAFGNVRTFPRGLDVMAVLGSERAENILYAFGDTDYVGYDQQFNKLKEEFEQFGRDEWNKNLYWSWLYCLKALLAKPEQGYPTFMQTDAWQDKQLNTALGSWTELRHDTILYSKQTYTIGWGCGGDWHPRVVGYVEPLPEFYARLLTVSRMTSQGLSSMNCLDANAQSRLAALESILQRLLDISLKELRNEELSEADYDYINDFGDHLEDAVLNISQKGLDHRLIADVHTDINSGKVLEEGVGNLDILLAAYKVPDGRIIIGAGPVFSYYEFKQPISQRLTDGEWRNLLNSCSCPGRPPWVSSFCLDNNNEDQRFFLPYTLGFLNDEVTFNGTAPLRLFKIGDLYGYLYVPISSYLSPDFYPLFIYADHPNIDFTLVDKDHPDYPMLANKDMRESLSGHEEDIISFQTHMGDELGPSLDDLITNLPVDPDDGLLPPYLPRLGQPVRYELNSSYLQDLEIALHKAGYSCWPTVAFLDLPFFWQQVFEDMQIFCKAGYRGLFDQETFFLSCVSYKIQNQAPLIEPIPDQYIYAGESLDYQVIAVDPDIEDQNGLIYEAALIDWLPCEPGQEPCHPLLIDPAIGAFNNVPFPSLGEYDITVRVTDPHGASVEEAFTLFVEESYKRYVCVKGKGRKDGLNWENAYQSIQQAVDEAPSGSEIWVAEGVYKENIVLKPEIMLYGGFQGTEKNLAEHLPCIHPTVIDGRNNGPCVVGARGAVLDGFVITNGLAECGGGIRCADYGMIIKNNRICKNTATDIGGGIYIEPAPDIEIPSGGVHIEICNNTIEKNEAGRGAGIACLHISGDIANNSIAENRALEQGGGLLLIGSGFYFFNNTVVTNQATEGGAGVCCLNSSSIEVKNSILWGNAKEDPSQPEDQMDGDEELLVDTDSLCTVHYSNIRGMGSNSYCVSGMGNMDQDPKLLGQGPGVYHLSLDSPCRDAGDPSNHDPDGSPCDLGAYGGEKADWSILIDPIEDKKIKVNQAFFLDIDASFPDQSIPLYYYDDTDLFDIDPATGEINFIPKTSHIGKYYVKITITDSLEKTVTCPFHLSISQISFPLFQTQQYPLYFSLPMMINPLGSLYYEDNLSSLLYLSVDLKKLNHFNSVLWSPYWLFNPYFATTNIYNNPYYSLYPGFIYQFNDYEYNNLLLAGYPQNISF